MVDSFFNPLVELFKDSFVYFDHVAYIPADSFLDLFAEGIRIYTKILSGLSFMMDLAFVGSVLLLTAVGVLLKVFYKRKKNSSSKAAIDDGCNINK